MAFNIPFKSGGALSPTSLDFVVTTGSTDSIAAFDEFFGAKKTADITSSTLTEVLNISGSGVLSFAALIPAGPFTYSSGTCKLRIVIDDLTVLDMNGLPITMVRTAMLSVIGVYCNKSNVGQGTSTELPIPFKSLVVSIAGNGDPVSFAYKRYLT